MVDAHVHLEKGKYCVEWIQEFIRYALMRDIDEIYFLEHTHIFKECQSLYDEMSHYNAYQNQWYRKKFEAARPLKEYTDFIENMKKEQFPIRIGGMGGGKDLTDEEIRKGTVHSPDMRVHSPDERKTAVIFTDMIRKKKREKRNEKPFFELQWLK